MVDAYGVYLPSLRMRISRYRDNCSSHSSLRGARRAMSAAECGNRSETLLAQHTRCQGLLFVEVRVQGRTMSLVPVGPAPTVVLHLGRQYWRHRLSQAWGPALADLLQFLCTTLPTHR